MNSQEEQMVTEAPLTEEVRELSRVDEHLAGLYRKAAGMEEPGAVPTVRTVLLNLVAYAQTEEEADEATDSVVEIAGSHPCRAIIIEAMAPRPGEPADSVSVICGITSRGDRRLCGEIIRLHTHECCWAVVGSVMPLLVGDVPVFLWVLGDIPAGDPQFDELVRFSNHLVIDSRRLGDLAQGIGAAARLTRAAPDRTLQDLAWISLQSWKELTAQHFDPPAVRSCVNRLTEAVIDYTPGERKGAPPSCALLLASWLINAVHLQVKRVSSLPEGGYWIQALQDDHSLDIRLLQREGGYGPGQLTSVTIRCRLDDEPATFITQGVSATELSMTEECRGVCLPPRVMEMPPQQTAALAAQAIDATRADYLYERALIVGSGILGRLKEATTRKVREVSEYGVQG